LSALQIAGTVVTDRSHASHKKIGTVTVSPELSLPEAALSREKMKMPVMSMRKSVKQPEKT
jgi:hypothetical protein